MLLKEGWPEESELGAAPEIRPIHRTDNEDLFMGITLNGASHSSKATRDDLLTALTNAKEAEENPFLIIERSGQEYIQCLCEETGWILEKREGDEDRHYRAMVNDNPIPRRAADAITIQDRIFASKEPPRMNLSFEEVSEAMTCYLQGAEEPAWLDWERIELR